MFFQAYTIKTVNSHVIILDEKGTFIESADSYEEAMQDIQNGEI